MQSTSKLIFCILSLICLFGFTLPVTAQDGSVDLSWQSLPIVPEIGANAREILRRGLESDVNPQAFSKVGDCDTSTDWYLADFDRDNRYYNLGDYETQLRPVLDYFAGSFGRRSLAAKPGFSAASVLSNFWLDYEQCSADELPLSCEYRINNPAFVLISLGSNDGYNPPTFKENLRQIILSTLEQNRLPILMTKADNTEGNYAINADIAALAKDYDLPLWNFWAAVQDLPDKGLQADGVHLTYYKNDFADATAATTAWYWRNLTALQVLEKVQQTLISLQQP